MFLQFVLAVSNVVERCLTIRARRYRSVRKNEEPHKLEVVIIEIKLLQNVHLFIMLYMCAHVMVICITDIYS